MEVAGLSAGQTEQLVEQLQLHVFWPRPDASGAVSAAEFLPDPAASLPVALPLPAAAVSFVVAVSFAAAAAADVAP